MTSREMTFDLTLEKDRSSFIMFCDALSNAAYRVSLRDPGTELGAESSWAKLGVQTPPARRQAPTRRGLTQSN